MTRRVRPPGNPPRVDEPVAARPVPHEVADGEALPLRVDSSGAWTTRVVEAVPGVPAPTISAHLDQPRPDLFGRRIDGDGHRRPSRSVGDHVGAGIWPGDFLITCAPAHEPRAHKESVDGGCRHGLTRQLPSEGHPTIVRACAQPRQRPMSRPRRSSVDWPQDGTRRYDASRRLATSASADCPRSGATPSSPSR